MVYVTNRPKEDNPSVIEVTPGIHVLTNASLDAAWPKVKGHKIPVYVLCSSVHRNLLGSLH